MSCDSRTFIRRTLASFSRMFEKAGNILIGLKLLSTFLLPALNTGTIFAILIGSGTTPNIND